MRPLLFVNWHMVNVRFRALMWILAFALVLVILLHVAPHSTAPHQQAGNPVTYHPGAKWGP
jgi:accessory gene regulator protein AgrB